MCTIFVLSSSRAKKQGTRSSMKTNVTIRMDETLLRKVRHRAVDEHLSTTRWIANVLEKATDVEENKDAIRHRALRRLESGFHMGGEPLGREQVHER